MITIKYRDCNCFHYNCSIKHQSRIDGIAELYCGRKFYIDDFGDPGDIIDLKSINVKEIAKGDII